MPYRICLDFFLVQQVLIFLSGKVNRMIYSDKMTVYFLKGRVSYRFRSDLLTCSGWSSILLSMPVNCYIVTNEESETIGEGAVLILLILMFLQHCVSCHFGLREIQYPLCQVHPSFWKHSSRPSLVLVLPDITRGATDRPAPPTNCTPLPSRTFIAVAVPCWNRAPTGHAHI